MDDKVSKGRIASIFSVEVNRRKRRLTLNLLTTTIVAHPSNASKWQMGFNSAFKGIVVVSRLRVKLSWHVAMKVLSHMRSNLLPSCVDVMHCLSLKAVYILTPFS